MSQTNFDLAPPPKLVDGLMAVPIAIQSINAKFTLDAAAKTGVGDATVQYNVGPTSGNPIFDLRQNITSAWVDGIAVSVSKVASHDFGAGSYSELRILESAQAAGSGHQLRLQYVLGTPNSQLTGAYLPALEWPASGRVRLTFGLSDLNAGRYLEAWIPANLIYNPCTLHLEVEVTGTTVEHAIITNGAVITVAVNHWVIDFPSRFTALSPLLEVRAADTLEHLEDSVVLPVSGATIPIQAWKLAGSAYDLAAEITLIKSYLVDNQLKYGSFLHDRFVAFFNVGGMEYEGGTTTNASSLRHETFHSWFARGVKPARQADGWWDEGFGTWHDNGADDTAPFDFTSAPVVLCSRDPWQRRTPGNSYVDGNTLFSGLAAMFGTTQLNTYMREFYEAYRGQPASTEMLEEFLITQSGNPQVVDAFHHFVYGLQDPSPAPDLWFEDDPADMGGNAWTGAFWDSPDLWVRHADDGGTDHQAPEYGQDNWFYARVRNKATAGMCRHFVVTFHAAQYPGVEFLYPGDFLPCTAARAGFDVAPGETRVVRARWPAALVPAPGTHACMLASVIARMDESGTSVHVWEHNNLAQKNLTIVDLLPNEYVIIPILVPGWWLESKIEMEVWRDRWVKDYSATLIAHAPELFATASRAFRPIDGSFREAGTESGESLDCGGHPTCTLGSHRAVITSRRPDLIAQRFGGTYEVPFANGLKAHIPIRVPHGSQAVMGVLIAAPPDAKAGDIIKTHVLRRDRRKNRITGGIAV